MSDYTVVAQVSDALRRVLWAEFSADPTTLQIVGAEAAVVLKNPTETARDSSNRLSLWLYQVTENEFLKNQSPLRGDELQVSHYPPLALNFFYLVTPFATSGEGDHMLLGKTMQVLYDNSKLLIRDPMNGIGSELRIILCNLSLEQLTRIWEALQQPYRLSVCYEVRVSRVDSKRTTTATRVVDRNLRIGSPEQVGARS